MRVETPGNVPIEDLPAVPEPSDKPAEKDPGEPTTDQGTCACSRAIEGSEECEACPEEECPGPSDTPACAPSVKVPPRPAIDVALESVRLHLDKHIAPLVARLRKWDTRKMPDDDRRMFKTALDAVIDSFAILEDFLVLLQSSGFVAKTTEATRTRAKIENGASVQLVLHKWNELLPVYGAERLNSRLTCSQVTDTHAVITTEDGSCLGAIRMTHLRVRPVPLELADE